MVKNKKPSTDQGKPSARAAAEEAVRVAHADFAAAEEALKNAATDEDKATADAALRDAGQAKEAAEAALAALLKPAVMGTMAIKQPLAVDTDAAEALIVITVIGPKEGRRRAGFLFGANPVAVAVTQAQLAIIKGDSDLSVSEGNLAESAEEIAIGASGEVSFAGERPPRETFIGSDGKPAAITVIGPATGRRRAGRQFGREAVTFTPTEAELEAILGDTDLSVQPA